MMDARDAGAPGMIEFWDLAGALLPAKPIA